MPYVPHCLIVSQMRNNLLKQDSNETACLRWSRCLIASMRQHRQVVHFPDVVSWCLEAEGSIDGPSASVTEFHMCGLMCELK